LVMGSAILRREPEDLRWSEGKIFDGSKLLTGEDILRQTFGGEGGEIIGKGVVIPGAGIDEDKWRPMFYESVVGMAEIEVDADTGRVKVCRYVGGADIGKAINLAQCEGQEEGAMMQGIGHTLFEEMVYGDGQLVNGSLVDYRVPRFLELPDDHESIFVENLDGPGPGGAKGMGEGGIIPVAAAVGNALARATGVRLRELPLKPDRVWEACVRAGVTSSKKGERS
jgi:CO/xanthine dehydrogenase Mo-binding subunit